MAGENISINGIIKLARPRSVPRALVLEAKEPQKVPNEYSRQAFEYGLCGFVWRGVVGWGEEGWPILWRRELPAARTEKPDVENSARNDAIKYF